VASIEMAGGALRFSCSGVDNGLASVVFLAIPDFTRGAGVLKVSQRGGGT
jgi:hypothetical protein